MWGDILVDGWLGVCKIFVGREWEGIGIFDEEIEVEVEFDLDGGDEKDE